MGKEKPLLNDLTFIDLETTGLNERDDEIIEYGAVRLVDGKEVERFEKLAHPGIALPFHIAKLTGIHDVDLEGAAPTSDVLNDFMEFLGDSVLVAHNADFERRFLEAKWRRPLENTFLDTLELARIVLPTATHHNLGALAQHYGIESGELHRAVADAELAADLWRHLLEDLRQLSGPVLRAMNDLLEATEHPLRDLFAGIEREKLDVFDTKKSFSGELPDFTDIIRERDRKPPPKPERAPLNTNQIAGLFESNGAFEQWLQRYEHRPEQIRMVRAVGEAFNQSLHLMVEAGTGTGKSMAYLVPAIFWSAHNREKVVVSTNTKNLQEQLFYKDIPFLQTALEPEITPALIKGRSNYVCGRRLLNALQDPGRELSEEERAGILPIVTWATRTTTGDIAENTGFRRSQHGGLWSRLYSTGDECLGKGCPRYRQCFLMKARAQAFQADLIVANHSVIFAEMGMESPVLPEYDHLIFDEAQNIEHVATEHFAVQIDKVRLRLELNRLYRPGRRGGRGMLARLLYHLRRSRETQLNEVEKRIEKLVIDCLQRIEHFPKAAQRFFGAVSMLFAAEKTRDNSVRFTKGSKLKDPWETIEADKRQLVAALAEIVHSLESIQDLLRHEQVHDFANRREFQKEVQSGVARLQELIHDLDFVLAAEDENFVYWAEVRDPQARDYRLAAAPLDVSRLLHERLYEHKETIVFCSATLTVAHSFDFVRHRLGFDLIGPERTRALDVGSSFDFRRQVLICIPTFLSEPTHGDKEFVHDLADMLIDLHRASRGRGLVLFTSYSMLNQVYPTTRRGLEAEGLLVLGQRIDGGREHLTRRFQDDIGSVLFGTQSFWEGVDVPGEALSCLTIAKLPFPVFNDPIIKARCEQIEAQGADSFLNYSLPSAVIRFRQGMGRLIRTRTDRGVVVIADRRILSRRYGREFLRSLPTDYLACATAGDLCQEVSKFLNGDPAQTA